MTARMRLAVAGIVAVALVAPAGAGQLAPARAETLDATATAEASSAALVGAAWSAEEASVGQAIADRLLVTFRRETTPADAARVLVEAGLDPTVIAGFDVQVVDVEPASASSVVAMLTAAPEVLTVSPDRKVAFVPATDPRRAEQWWWENVGQPVEGVSDEPQAGRAGMDIGARLAWRASRGRGVVVAIVDTGIDTSHPDLRDNLWVNPRPSSFPGCVGDRHGCNFTGYGASGSVFASAAEDAHGTHVAGIVAAAENGLGTVGVAPRAELLSAKFMRGDTGRVGDGVRAIQYAVESGADVINLSWGVIEGDLSPHGRATYERTIRDAKVPFVVAAGNWGTCPDPSGAREGLEDVPVYPATSTQPNVIVVTAMDNRGEVPCFASTSTSLVDVAAPGVSVLSTFPGGTYGTLRGTSQAAPAVTGAVALAIAATGERDGVRLAEAVRAGARPFGYLSHPWRPSGLSRAGVASAPGTIQALGRDLGACRDGVRASSFGDRTAAGVHATNVDCIVHHGLAGGFADGTFRPQRTVTRGQVATFLAGLVRTARDLPVPADGRFRDLTGDVHRDNIEALAARGIIDGYPDGGYRSGAPVTREQFASLLVRTYEHLSEGRVRPSGHRFPDVSGLHEHNVRAGAQLGFIEGRSDGRFAPRDGVTRAQLGSLMRRALDKLVNDRISSVG